MITKLGKADSFTLFGKNGMMQQNERVHISRGTKIFAFGYAMSEQEFVVYDDNMNAVEIADTEEVSEYELERYFSPKHHLDETTRPISEKFGIGFYYDESGEVVPDEVIEKSLRRAENYHRLQEEVKQRKEREDVETEKRLLKEYSYLERCKERFDHKVCGKNIRTELKKEFPNVKFSVRYESFSGGDAYRISWTDGPMQNQVKKIVDKYKDMHPDEYSMGDYWDCVPSIFNNLYGSVSYVTTSRYFSEDVAKKVQAHYPGLTEENHVNYHFEDNAINTYAYHHEGESYESFLRHLAHFTDLTEKVEKIKSESERVHVEGIEVIEDYSEKSFLVKGNTYGIKDELQKIGCIWLRKEQAWCFSKKKREAVRKFLMC